VSTTFKYAIKSTNSTEIRPLKHTVTTWKCYFILQLFEIVQLKQQNAHSPETSLIHEQRTYPMTHDTPILANVGTENQ